MKVRMNSVALVGIVSVVLAAGSAWGQRNEPAELYHFNTLAIGGGEDDSYIDLHGGSDMLPYTADDIALPERGNVGGTWGFAHHDLNSDGVVDENEHIFDVIRRDDDDAFTFSALSHPEYGVIYESEDWIDYHDARNEGPSATLAGDLGAEGNDFEHNDRRPWEGESNAYMYNNLQADQHGKGKPKYYLENINPGSEPAAGEAWVYDEIEGFQKPLNFQHNLDDPATALDERNGPCRQDYFRTFDHTQRGYLIPVDDLADLEDGSLPSLFGWEAEGFDLAAYLRDTIEPKLWDTANPDQPNPNMTLYHGELGTQETNLPITHLMLLQIEVPIVVNVGDTCGVQADAQAMADYWGIPATGATYRASHILGYNDVLTDTMFFGEVRNWVEAPADGASRNVWMLDHFYRDDASHLGKYSFSPGGAGDLYSIVDDPSFAVVDNTVNKVLTGAGMIRAPLPRALQGSELPIELVADLAAVDPAEPSFQLVLFAGGEVRAYAELSEAGTSVRVGGDDDGSGWITGGEGADGDPATLGVFDVPSRAADFTRNVLVVGGERISLLELTAGGYQQNDFSELNADEMEELVGLNIADGRDLAGIDEIAVAANDGAAINTIALLAAPPGTFTGPQGALMVPSDCNNDGGRDLSDGVCILGHLFLGTPDELPCGDGRVEDSANISLLDNDANGEIQLSDAVNLFQFLFLGGPPPTPCVDAECLVCIRIVGCPGAPRGCQ